MGMQVLGAIEVSAATVDDVADLTAVSQAVALADPTDRPEVPPYTADEVRALQFGFPPDRPCRSWLARDAATGAAIGWVLIREPMAANRTHVEVRVEVRPERRRQGVAAELLRVVLAAADPSRTTVSAHADVAALAWCESLGLPSRQVVRESRLDLEECDLDLVRSWLAPPVAVGAGYRIVSWRGPTPDEHLPAACTAIASMADAPLDDVEFEQPVLTPALVRATEAAVGARLDQLCSLALAPDGSAAGFTELGVTWNRPVLGDQGDTVVVAEHRGHRLGRWLKAVNLLAAMAVHPELRFVNTYNAESNPWMLSINEDMGFRPFREIHTVQGPTADVLARVSGTVTG
jgi:GNAT superfamily N-acetyltransferase